MGPMLLDAPDDGRPVTFARPDDVCFAGACGSPVDFASVAVLAVIVLFMLRRLLTRRNASRD
jgi:hypothetical protein